MYLTQLLVKASLMANEEPMDKLKSSIEESSNSHSSMPSLSSQRRYSWSSGDSSDSQEWHNKMPPVLVTTSDFTEDKKVAVKNMLEEERN